MRADVVTLVAKKLQSSPAVEGKLPKDGLAVIRDDGDDLDAGPRKADGQR